MEILLRRVHNCRPFRLWKRTRPAYFSNSSFQLIPPMAVQHNKVFRLERDGDVLIVIPQGDAIGFRYNDVHQESNATLKLLDSPALQHVVIDFGCEEVLGSIIISVVIKVCRKIGQKGGRAAFCNALPDMQEVLQTMNLTRLWNYYPTRAEAIAAVRTA